MVISIQGYKGSYHDLVAKHAFGENIKTLERDTFKEVFDDVHNDKADYGVVAIENSIAGSIIENYDLLLKENLYIIGELYLRIAHQLLVLPGTEIEEIQEVYSHPMALKQCTDFLEQHPDWKVIEYPDTAGAAAMIRRDRKFNSAAIASRLCESIYELDIVAKDIETNKNNYTRFLIISKTKKYDQAANKSSIVFTAAHKPGSLAKVLSFFADFEINLTKIESRPIIGKEWSYYFYLDFEAGIQEQRTMDVLELMGDYTSWINVLGSYKQGQLFE